MTTWFVSRHAGAVTWIAKQGIVVDEVVAHFNVALVQSGDTVIGTLPINLVADVNERSARYLHLTLDLPADVRGAELTPEQMERYGARLVEFRAQRVDGS